MTEHTGGAWWTGSKGAPGKQVVAILHGFNGVATQAVYSTDDVASFHIVGNARIMAASLDMKAAIAEFLADVQEHGVSSVRTSHRIQQMRRALAKANGP